MFFCLLFRWFWHFYALSVCWNTLLLVFHLNFTFQGHSYPSWLIRLLDTLTTAPSPSKEGRLPSSIANAKLVIMLQSHTVFSSTAVDSAAAAADQHPLSEEAAGVPVCQCLLQHRSHSSGAVRVWPGLLRPAGVDSPLLRPSRTRFTCSHSLRSG